ncbi:hypothetical protein AB0E69_33300 [Kribbella sp. NPDC026611]|uniref:hypothetical protein n=1 Tax=Kribbella sp. NPDC026611 TaxID=3154911 RepID=UPI0033F4D002
MTKEFTAESVTAGPKAEAHVDAFTPYIEAGFDEVYVANIGPHTIDMMNLYRTEILPELRRNLSAQGAALWASTKSARQSTSHRTSSTTASTTSTTSPTSSPG